MYTVFRPNSTQVANVGTENNNSSNSVSSSGTVSKANTVSSSSRIQSVSGDGYDYVITLGDKTFKLYEQEYGSYASTMYNSSANVDWGYTIRGVGCGPTSVARILSGYGINLDPGQVGTIFFNNSTTIPSGIRNMAKEVNKIGLTAVAHEYTSNYNNAYSEMKRGLEQGHQIVLYVGMGGDRDCWYQFTHGGYHYISVLGLDSSNDKAFAWSVFPGDTGWFDLSTIVKARGSLSQSPYREWPGWVEIYQ